MATASRLIARRRTGRAPGLSRRRASTRVAPSGSPGAIAFGRDLINTPANDLAPDGLEAAARELASKFGASFTATVGDALLDANLPMIHAVGRASATPPRLIDFSWGDDAAPKVTLVGKGVTFDTGGLNIKPDAAMLLMKKDMGGAATALAAARMVMAEKLPVRLRVLVPAVENAISGSAFRPGDILRSRKGLSVEIGNTDAEGRLILADALALADEEAPELWPISRRSRARRALRSVRTFRPSTRRTMPSRPRSWSLALASMTRSGGCPSGRPMTRCSPRASPM